MPSQPTDMKEQSPPGPNGRWPADASRWLFFVCLLGVMAGQAGMSGAESVPAAQDNGVLRLGFTSGVFMGVNENDAKAAMKIWGQTIAKEHGVTVVAEPTVLNGPEAIISAIQKSLVDAFTITVVEYWAMGGQGLSTNTVLGVNNGVATEDYVVLVHRDSNFGRIEDLRGHSLNFFQNVRNSLAPIWFETLLLQSGLGTTDKFCGRVTQATKLSQAVLPVFFRQTDACVVTRRGFQTMIELNPQVGQRLKTLATSPALIPVVFAFREAYSSPVKGQIMAEIQKVHFTASGQQVLTLFQSDSLEVRPVSALAPALELLETHARLCKATNATDTAGTNLAPAPAKAGGP